MDIEKFKRAYGESRNGANVLVRHPLVRSFVMSDGVKDCADCGCWWLMDIIATEVPWLMKDTKETLATITVKVKKGKASITASGHQDVPLPWKRAGIWTDMPEGEWVFLVSDNDDHRLILLVSEY